MKPGFVIHIMAQSWRPGEVTQVTVHASSPKPTGITDRKFELQVQACSRYLHPAHYAITPESPRFSLSLRFKDLLSLHNKLIFLYPTLSLPSFPPSKWLFFSLSNIYRKKVHELGQYFQELLEIGEIRRSLVLMETLSPQIRLNIRLIGADKLLVETFRRNFLDYKPKSSRRLSEMPSTPPLDLLITDTLVRVLSIDCVLAEDSMWLLEEVRNKTVTVVVRRENCETGEFQEGKWACNEDLQENQSLEMRKNAFDTVINVISKFIKRFS